MRPSGGEALTLLSHHLQKGRTAIGLRRKTMGNVMEGTPRPKHQYAVIKELRKIVGRLEDQIKEKDEELQKHFDFFADPIPEGYLPVAVRDDRNGTCVMSFNPVTKMFYFSVNEIAAGPYKLDELKSLRENIDDIVTMKGHFVFITAYDAYGKSDD